MKTAVITLSIGNNREFATITLSSFKRYADKIGADFYVYGNFDMPYEYSGVVCGRRTEHNVYTKKLVAIHNALDTYDRIIYLDDSCYINHDCPDIFSVVPEKFMAMHNEGSMTFNIAIADISNNTVIKNGLKHIPKRNYFNSGIIVASKQHQFLFSSNIVADSTLKKLIDCEFPDQTLLNYIVNNYHVPYWPLSHLFGKVCVFDNSDVDYGDKSADDLRQFILSTHNFDFLTKENTAPGYINHAFIYHFTSIWNNQQRYDLCKRLEELTYYGS